MRWWRHRRHSSLTKSDQETKMDKQFEMAASDVQAAAGVNQSAWCNLTELELASVGGGIGDTVL
jgi:hypothetical protein